MGVYVHTRCVRNEGATGRREEESTRACGCEEQKCGDDIRKILPSEHLQKPVAS